ncbi:nucleotide exchange factor GrpE [Actinosynnema pretiosum subsp. pretiosum]|uniref:Protein GrpE n=2 Tax=Actinosynnema TaxID=40566 RepID=C6WR50_ACTMD|nr:nucleotide exchange factor GrpE [Actinosynnema mirum]ACU40743.1 GrpE protein [Actinosynnema mirum DSM 43827]AXX34247.1 Heat shock protein GrpE [Actinosynnema pretiosum subsp. pretiosum]QUF02036.1 nucleotide exchange factor GrpE [Actinosynnema pretiosum subsp. pretiosum]
MTSADQQPEDVSAEEQPDLRRVDPETGEIRAESAADTTSPAGNGGGKHAAPEPEGVAEVDPAAELKAQLDERTADLQRLTAEYANYRKRVERDREVVVATAKAKVVGDLLGVLDDVERAGQHGDLTGAFKAVADKLVAALTATGLEGFGEAGEAFDPAVHEAVQHSTSPDVPGPTVTAVFRRGYRFADRVLRPAMVVVTDYEPAPAQPEQAQAEQQD